MVLLINAPGSETDHHINLGASKTIAACSTALAVNLVAISTRMPRKSLFLPGCHPRPSLRRQHGDSRRRAGEILQRDFDRWGDDDQDPLMSLSLRSNIRNHITRIRWRIANFILHYSFSAMARAFLRLVVGCDSDHLFHYWRVGVVWMYCRR